MRTTKVNKFTRNVRLLFLNRFNLLLLLTSVNCCCVRTAVNTVRHKLLFIWWLLKGPFFWWVSFLSWSLGHSVIWNNLFSRLLFQLSVQMKELVVVYVKIEPFAVLTIHIVHNKIYFSRSFLRYLWRFGPILRQQNPLCKQYRSTAIADEE